MPTIRYEIRGEYGLADPELYRAADEDDPEALLEGVAMAGLVGVLRQLGDLAEFAAELFRDLHEEVTVTAGRGHGLMLRVQQLEAEFPLIEKAFLSQTNPSPLAYNEGIEWHANLRMNQNLITQGDMPRFILDSYGECRGPPRLFMLDKFDVAGAGACLKRYSDPSFFKVDFAASGMMEEEVREKKARKIKKKGSRWRDGKTTKSFLEPLVRSNLEPVVSEKISTKVPMRHIRLKSRNLMDSDITNKRSYMEHLLEPVAVVHENITDIAANYLIAKRRNVSKSLVKMEPENSAFELANEEIESIKALTSVLDEKIITESNDETALTVSGYNWNEAEKCNLESVKVDKQKYFVDTQRSRTDGFHDNGFAGIDRRETTADTYKSIGVETDPSGLVVVDQTHSLAQSVLLSDVGMDGYRSDDVGSELEKYLDALNTMEPEIETDSESRFKLDPMVLHMEAHKIDGSNEPQQELSNQFSESDDCWSPKEKGLTGSNDEIISSPSTSENSCSSSVTQRSERESFISDVPVIPEICLSEPARIPEERHMNNMVENLMPSVELLTKDISNTAEERACPQASNELLSVTAHPTETFPGYIEDNHVGQQLDGIIEDLPRYKPETCLDELSHMAGSFVDREDTPEDTHVKYADEAAALTLHPLNATFLDSAGNAGEASQQLITKEDVSISASTGSLKLTSPAEDPNAISDRISILDSLSLRQDHSSLDDASAQFDETTLLTLENTLHVDEQQKYSKEQESEVLSDENIANLSSSICSAIVMSGEPGADRKDTTNAENLATQESSNYVRRVGENLDGSLSGSVNTTELSSPDHDSMEYLKPVAYSIISFDDPLPESVVRDRADTAEVEEGEVSEYNKANTENNSTAIEAHTEHAVDPIISLTEEHTETFSCPMLPAINTDLSVETTTIVPLPEELAENVDNNDAFSEDLIELEQFSAEKKPEKSQELDSAENSPRCYIVNTFLDGENLQSTGSVTDETDLVANDLAFACGPTPSNLQKEVHSEEKSECDDSLDEYVILEADDDNQDNYSISSPKTSTFDIEFQEDYLPADAVLESRNLENSEMYDSKSRNVMPSVDSQIMSSEVFCTDSPTVDSSISSNLTLSDDALKMTASDSVIDKGSPSNGDDSFSIEGTDMSTFILEPEISVPDGNQEKLTPSDQEVDHLEVSDIQSERVLSDEHNINQNNSSHVTESLTPEPDSILTTVKRQELDILSSSDLRYGQREVDPVPSEPTSKISTGSVTSHISPVVSSFSSYVSETGLQDFLELHEVQPTSSLQLQEVEDVPPLLPVEEFSEANVVEEVSSLPSEDVEGIPIAPVSAIEEFSEIKEVEKAPSLQLEDVKGIPSAPLPPVEKFSETKVVEEASSSQLEDVERTPPLPLPPVEWRMGKLRFGSMTSIGDTSQHPKSTNSFMESSALDVKHSQDSLAAGVQLIQPTPFLSAESFNSLSLTQHMEASLLEDENLLQCGTSPQNHASLPCTENENISGADDVSVSAVETQDPKLLQGAPSIESKRPRLDQLVPSLDLERSKHEFISMRDPMHSMNPFLEVSSSGEYKYQYGYGVYGGGGGLQHPNLPPPIPVTGHSMPPYGFLYPMGENPSMIYDIMLPSAEGERPTWKHRSIRDLPRNPLIEAVAAHDKSTLRKVSELDPPQVKPKADEMDSLLEQIRNKSFNLKPANAPMPNMKGPPTNIKLAAILEKANAIRQAFVGSDEDDDDSESWNDT